MTFTIIADEEVLRTLVLFLFKWREALNVSWSFNRFDSPINLFYEKHVKVYF